MTTTRLNTFYIDTKAEPITLFVTDCPVCGVVFAITTRLERARHSDGKLFYCPNGHSMSWHQTTEDVLRKQLESARDDLARTRQTLAYESRSHAATKGQVTKLKKRVAMGVCPCCTRTFQNLARHMATKHPEYPEA